MTVFAAYSLTPAPAYANGLFDLAAEFFNRLSPVYEEKKEFSPLDQIPEGGTLLLKPRSEKIFFGQEIFAVKNNNQVYLNIDDFINILEFPIDYDPETMSGSGWYLREDWNMSLDLQGGVVQSRNKSFVVDDDDIYEQDGMVFAKAAAMEQWFGLLFDFDIEQQIINIESPFPFPAVARIKREQNFAGRNEVTRRVAKLPRMHQERKMFDINAADFSLGNRVQRQKSGRSTNQQTASVRAQGEVLKHNAYVFVNADDRDQVRSIRGEIFKRSEKADLLGPLEARFYSIGDVNEVRVPLMSDGQQNFGFQFTNSSLNNTDFATTDIEGILFPGWDVQLYRNGILIDSVTIEQSGEYEFNDIQLFAGDNDFELFFFGPQGEVRSEQVSVPVSKALLSSQDNTYEFALTFEDAQTYQEVSNDDEDTNTPNITARYNKLIGDNHLAYLGFRTAQLGGDRKFYLSTGSTSTVGASIVDTNLAVDEEGNASAQASLRRNLMGWNTSVRARYNTEDYQTQQAPLSTAYEFALNAQRSISFLGFSTSLLLDSLYSKRHDGGELTAASAAISNRLFDTSISNRVSYEENIDGDSSRPKEEKLFHTLALRRNFGRFFLNLRSRYEFEPEQELQTVTAQMNYRFNNDFSTDLTLERRFANDLDTAQLNFNYIHDKFRLSPFIQYNSDEELLAGLNLNFSLYDEPNSQWPSITSDRLARRGALSALVYHDKNVNRVFDEGDEPLKDAMVESIQSPLRAMTDEDGYALIYDLPTRRATDITITDGGLPDPFMVPAAEGRSIVPRAGTIHEMEFPVNLTGEVDGMVYAIADEDGQKSSVSFQDVMIIPLDDAEREIQTVKAERDGYYVAYMLPPGNYMLTTAPDKNYGNTAPQFITIGPDGTIVRDINLQVDKGLPYVDYQVAFNRTRTMPDNYRDYSRMLRVKRSGASSLSKLLFTAINEQAEPLLDGMVKVNNLKMDDGLYDYYVPVATKDLENPMYMHRICQAMKEKLAECSIIVNANAEIKDNPNDVAQRR